MSTSLEHLPLPEPPLQFSLRGLLLFQAVCAIFLAMLLNTGIFAVFVAFLVTLVLMLAPVPPDYQRVKRFAADCMAGAVLPGLCLAFDPGIIADHSLVALAYLAIAFQMVVFVAWLFVGPRWPWVSAMTAGMLLVGSLLAAGIGIVMLPFSVIGLFVMGSGCWVPLRS